MILCGIDPGLSGALAFLDTEAGKLDVIDMPAVEIKRNNKTKREVSAAMLAGIIRSREVHSAIVERVGAMPGQGVSSVYAFGRSVGMIEGVLAGLMIPTDYVTPQRWQKELGVRNGKDGSRELAARLFPAYAAMFSRKKDDGRADAACIAYWAATQSL
jgi:crossover junction endodeoxyribonuclease RuvC